MLPLYLHGSTDFRLGYFERKYTFYNQSSLQGEITRHYTQQAIKQMYVLVLGLDVLGNPFGLIRGFAEGIEDLFYEPYQVCSLKFAWCSPDQLYNVMHKILFLQLLQKWSCLN